MMLCSCSLQFIYFVYTKFYICITVTPQIPRLWPWQSPFYSPLLWVWLFYFIVFFYFLGPHPWHMEVSRLGVKSELQLAACATDASLRHSSQRCCILNPLSKTRDQTHILMDTSSSPQSHNGYSEFDYIKFLIYWNHAFFVLLWLA